MEQVLWRLHPFKKVATFNFLKGSDFVVNLRTMKSRDVTGRHGIFIIH